MPIIAFELHPRYGGKVDPRTIPALDTYGLYLFWHREAPIRIGEPKLGRKRIRAGFNDALERSGGKKNYAAYQWRTRYEGEILRVDYFTLDPVPFMVDEFRRALDDELTFQFRIANKAWPLEMNEIHFTERLRQNDTVVQNLTQILDHYEITYDASV